MAIDFNKIITEQEYAAERKRIKEKHHATMVLLVLIDVLSALSTALVLFDIAQLIMIEVAVLTSVATAPLTILIVLGVISIFCIGCAIACGIYMVRKENNNLNGKLQLLDEHYNHNKERANQIVRFKAYVQELLELKPDAHLKQLYQQLENPEVDTRKSIEDIKLYLQQDRKCKLCNVLPQKNSMPSDTSNKLSTFKYYNDKYFARLIMFFTGSGQILGIAASIIGVTVFGTGMGLLLSSPVGWAIIGVSLLLTVIVGLISVWLESRTQAQEKDVTKLQQEDKGFIADTEFCEKCARQVIKYRDALLMRPDLFEQTEKEEKASGHSQVNDRFFLPRRSAGTIIPVIANKQPKIEVNLSINAAVTPAMRK